MIQFYAPDIFSSKILPPEESLHCCKVLRKREGDIIYVTDGNGNRFECSLKKASPKGAELEIIGELLIPKGWDFMVTLAVAITKNADRMAWLVEKATEIGVDKIIFLDCRFNERHTINTERLRRNAVSAMNQSLKTRLPEIEGAIGFKDFIDRGLTGKKYFGYCDEQIQRKNLARELKPGEDVTIVIGPEGDFSQEEVEMMISNGFIPSVFTQARLRTETAALFALQTAHIINELSHNN